VSYRSLIDKQVSNAFNKVKDLAVEATFTKRTSTGFDWNAGKTTSTSLAPIAVKLVVVETEKPAKGTNTIVKTVLLKASEVGDLNSYDSVKFEGFDWKLGERLHESGRVWMVKLFREA